MELNIGLVNTHSEQVFEVCLRPEVNIDPAITALHGIREILHPPQQHKNSTRDNGIAYQFHHTDRHKQFVHHFSAV